MATTQKGDRVLDANPFTQYGEGTVISEVVGDVIRVRFDSYRGYRGPDDAHYRGPGLFTLITPVIEPLADWEWELLGGHPNEPIFRALVESRINPGESSMLDMLVHTYLPYPARHTS